MREDPWAGISRASEHMVGRRVPGEHPLDIYWIRGVDGSPGLLLRGVDADKSPDQMPQPRGLELDLISRDGVSEVRMLLREREAHGVFLTLCKDVISYSGSSESTTGATSRVFIRLSDWQSMLSRARTSALSSREIRGLIGELLVLERLFESIGVDAALRSWVAPDDHPQDFARQERVIEVKARLSGARQSVHISSLQQLESAHLPLALVVVELVSAVSENAFTLNLLIEKLLSLARESGIPEVDALEVALLRRGYVHLDAYDADAYSVSGITAYDCREGFPRIVRSGVDARIPEAQYTLDLSQLVEFKVAVSSILD